MVILDSNDYYDALSLPSNSVENSVQKDVNSMRFYVKTFFGVFGWILCLDNPADVGTRLDSALTEKFLLTMPTGLHKTYLSGCELGG